MSIKHEQQDIILGMAQLGTEKLSEQTATTLEQKRKQYQDLKKEVRTRNIIRNLLCTILQNQNLNNRLLPQAMLES